ncbi:MAG TPA: efflux RND transporter permease subunit [Phycisphaerae bacterium]|nr:efflux RND transporter permease subunit [Phycisphaerae bacterium]
MGVIRRFVHNPVAANMLMILLLAGGGLAALGIPRELFPEFSVDMVSVTVPYPGASPAEVEEGIVLKIEEAVAGLEGVKQITAEAREGLGTVLVEVETGADTTDVLDRVKMEVDKIDSFPIDAEEHSVVEVTLRRHVINVAVAGDAPERTLKEIAEEVRDGLADLPEITQAIVNGTREYEVSVELSEEALRRYGLTLGRVAQAIREGSFDLPAGTVKTRAGEIAIRVLGQRRRAEEFRTIPVLYQPDGTILRLSDVAAVRESFEDVDIAGQFNGKPAALVSVFKTGDEDTIEIARAVRKYIQGKQAEMPEGIVLEPWSDYTLLIEDRLDMLIRNGRTGLGIVFVVLLLFLGVRLSFWVAMGIPVSILGTILVLHLTGMTMNMMSMFALIMALGLIVDDAIVVGENVHSHVERGELPRLASVAGTREVLAPVVGAVVTTWLAFMPLLFVPGVMGKFIRILPIAVVLGLGFSLLECLLILPAHLAHSLERQIAAREGQGRFREAARRVRARLDAGIRTMIHSGFLPLYRVVVRYRYVTLAGAIAVAALIAGAQAGGRIQFITFPKIDSDTLQGVVVLPTGTPIERTQDIARRLAREARRLNEEFRSRSGEPVVQRVYSLIGQQSGFGGESGSHVTEVIVELLPAEQRGVQSKLLIDRWRESTAQVPDALRVTFGAFRGGPGGKALEISLLGPRVDEIKKAAEALKDRLAEYPGVTDITDDALPGKPEMKVTLKPEALALNIPLRTLAVQLRDAFYGNESVKIQRGRDEIKVMVRYPPEQRRNLGDVEDLRVRTLAGDEVPFGEVAQVKTERGYTTLRRKDRRPVVTVSADIDEDVANAEEVLGKLQQEGFFLRLEEAHPGLKVDLAGQRQQAAESLDALLVWFPLALLGIYTVLAAIFRSYVQPVIVMVAIPFGLVGAVIGHWVFGYEVTLLSMFGMVALAGIVVNDSLVLIDMVNRRIREGAKVHEAVEAGARDRFRPIFLTTATTVAGMAPLLAEQSFQAQFLKPMVVAIAFGLSLATMLTLLVVPSLYLIGNDLRRVLWWLRRGEWPTPEAVLHGSELAPEGE